MPSVAALVSIFEPLSEIGLRVLLVMACGLLALVAVRMSKRAIRERCAGPSSQAGPSGLSASALLGSVLRAWLSMAARRCRGACRTR
jgi:hypothetical protein